MKYKVSMDKKGKVSVDKELGTSLTEEKAKFFRHLNNVMANKLIKPSIIMEYVNQYNISMGEE
jgi:hypothetical protein